MIQETTAWHALPRSEVLSRLHSKTFGLTSQGVGERRRQWGWNVLPKKKPFSLVGLFLKQFTSVLMVILVIASVISFFLGDYLDAYVILAAVGLNVLVGFIQEFRAQRSLEKLQEVVSYYVTVLRDGNDVRLESKDLVPGDIVRLRAGKRIPADIRILEAHDVQVNEAPLTGESTPVKKGTQTLKPNIPVMDQANMLFAGTAVLTGTVWGIVVRTGVQTELGQIASLVQATPERETPLQKRLASFGRRLALLIVLLSLGIFLLGRALGYGVQEMFTTAVAITVSAIPEGLVVAITVVLAIGMQRILKQNALVRQLASAETLGSTTVICTDKTGTLTKAEMQVVKIVTYHHDLNFSAAQFRDGTDHASRSYFLALKIGLLASDAYVQNPKDALDEWVSVGNTTERALVQAAIVAGIDQEKTRYDQPRLEEIPFDSSRKYMVTVHQDKNGKRVLYAKGAPEVLLHKAGSVDLDGRKQSLDEKTKRRFEEQYRTLSRQGLRILAVGYKSVPSNYVLGGDQAFFDELTFVGFLCIKDPLRKGTTETIQEAKAAGIRTVMVTGDHRFTAQAIAKELGMPSGDENIIEGEEFSRLPPAKINERVKQVSVFARVSPHDKLAIVDAFQQQGEVVAMTGDGINDAPALQMADIGIALGSGTDVAKETADMVIMDNQFGTIVAAVREGRILFENIKRIVLYLLSNSFTEMIVITAAVILGFPLPLAASQILWVNIINDGFPSVALTLEPGERDVMQPASKQKRRVIVDAPMRILIIVISGVSGVGILLLFYFRYIATNNLDYARTVAFAALGMMSLFYVFSCRSLKYPLWKQNFFRNPWLLVAVLAGIVLQLLAVYAPSLQVIFHTQPIHLLDWLRVVIFSLSVVALIEIVKFVFTKVKNNNP